ncbi:nephrin [Caerostris extrusa]|uniref:Nephrin n=1 Tax=Caerostris extrusa TaxID=172846 RepID=A0AAV4QDJ5_CAEEX|nr:nephrin [Caerostris extrusa]
MKSPDGYMFGHVRHESWHGGHRKPTPHLTWWRESVLLDDSYEVSTEGVVRNEIEITSLQRHDLMAVFTCQASNNNITVPVSKYVTVDMNSSMVKKNRVLFYLRKKKNTSSKKSLTMQTKSIRALCLEKLDTARIYPTTMVKHGMPLEDRMEKRTKKKMADTTTPRNSKKY